MDLQATITESDLEDMLDNEAAEPKALPLSLLAEITNGFSDKLEIGRGGFAVVYKAMLENGDVAVKRLMSDAHMYENEFHREVECLMKVKHKNIVRFLGYCADTQGNVGSYNGKFVMADVQQRLLCFEYLPNGNLQDYITDASDGLEWKERYKIIKGICEGLHYLHQINILHLDLKPANILLDENMIPKITDFGLSRCFDQEQTRVITTKVSGTMGYLAPEFTSHEITHKFDLYSLGTIITEILTGKRGYQPVENVLESWSNRLGISPENPQWKQIQVCAEIGIKCTKFNPAKRPDTMLQIVNRLVEMEGAEVIQAAEPKELFDVHPLELCFPFESNKKIPCSLHLTNNTKEHMAFRLMVPVDQYNYYFEKLPLYDIVPPRSTYTLVVTMEGRESQPTKGIDLILERITLGDEHIHTYQSQPEKFIEKAKDMGNVVHVVTLKVVFALPREITTPSLSKPISPEIKILSTGDWCYSLDTNHAKQWIITGQSYGHVRIWNSQTKQILDSFKVSDARVTCVKFIARKQWFVAGMDNGLIHVYEYCKTKMRKIISFRTSQRNVHSLAVHPTQPYLLSSHNTEMKLWDWDKGWECTQTFENEHSNTILHVAFNPKDTIASASEDHRVKVWSLNSPISRHNFSEHSNKVNCLDFFTCYDQEYLVTASDDQTAKIWDMQKKICVRTLETFTSPVTSVLYQPKLQILITGSEDGSVYLWNTTSSRINSRSPRLERIVNIGCDGGVHSLAYLMGRVVIGQNYAVAIMDIDNSLNNLEQSTDEYSEPLSSAYNDTTRSATDTTGKVISSSSSSTSELLAVALELIRFPCEPNESKSWSLHLTNNTDEHVAFRLIGKSSGSIAPFTELPLYGIVPSRSSYTLVVSTTKEVLIRATETGLDAILQSSTSGNKYATLFRNEDECHDFFGEAKEMGNDVHEVAVLLKVDCHVPQSEETNSKVKS